MPSLHRPAHAPTILGLAALLLAAACSSGTKPRLPSADDLLRSPSVRVQLTHAEPDDALNVGSYVSTGKGFATRSYWIEGPEGLILIDTQFLLSAGDEFVDWAQAVTGKRVVLAVVLHPNPDKFNGVGTLRKRGIRVISSDQVRALIPSVHSLRKGWFYERFKPDYPESIELPESFGSATTEIQAAGLALKLHVLGPGCSATHVVAQVGAHLFPGDLVTNDFHAWLELGRLGEWRARLDELMELDDVEYVHPGRGPDGDMGLIEQQAAYFERVESVIRAANPRLSADDAAVTRTQEAVLEAFPGLRYPLFAEKGIRPAILGLRRR